MTIDQRRPLLWLLLGAAAGDVRVLGKVQGHSLTSVGLTAFYLAAYTCIRVQRSADTAKPSCSHRHLHLYDLYSWQVGPSAAHSSIYPGCYSLE